MRVILDDTRLKTYSKSKKIVLDTKELEIPEVDIVAFDVSDLLHNQKILYIEDCVKDHAVTATINIDSRICVVGFPLGENDTTGLPIFKYSFIASEPDVDQKDPYFYIYKFTLWNVWRSCFYREKLPIVSASSVSSVRIKYASKLVGVYAGRCSNEVDYITSHLGRVWRYELIDCIIDGTVYISQKHLCNESSIYTVSSGNDLLDNSTALLVSSPEISLTKPV